VSTSATTGVAGRYASALFELADNAKALDQVAQDLDTFSRLARESPTLPPDRQPGDRPRLQGKALLAVLDAAGIKGLTRKFIGTVPANGRAREPAGDGYGLSRRAGAPPRRDQRRRHLGRAAHPQQLQQLTDALRSVLGGAKVSIDAHVEPGHSRRSRRQGRVAPRSIRPSAASCSVCSLP
jgi:F-type H+-transporting ATPase subunit delta